MRLTKFDYDRLHKHLTGIGFRVMKKEDWDFPKNPKNLRPARTDEGIEIIYCYDNHGYKVVVKTSFNNYSKTPFVSGSGSVMLIDIETGRNIWTSYRLNRTKHFLTRLVSFAEIMQKEVVHRPVCPECSSLMNLVEDKKVLTEYSWVCTEAHLSVGPAANFFPLFSFMSEGEKYFIDDFYKNKKISKHPSKKTVMPGEAKSRREIW